MTAGHAAATAQTRIIHRPQARPHRWLRWRSPSSAEVLRAAQASPRRRRWGAYLHRRRCRQQERKKARELSKRVLRGPLHGEPDNEKLRKLSRQRTFLLLLVV